MLLSATVYKYRGNASGSIMGRFIKPRASTIFFHPEYSLDGPGPSIVVSGPHEEFLDSVFVIWIGVKYFSGGSCRPIRIQELWRALGLRQHIV